MENSFNTVFANSSSVLVLLPKKPTFDEVASGLSLYLLLQGVRDVSIYSPSSMTVDFNRLVGVNKVLNKIGDKNLVIKFSNYDGKNVERVSADIESGLFQLTVIPKSGVSAPTRNQIDISYVGISSDTVVLIGGKDESDFPMLSTKEISNTNIVYVGNKDFRFSKGRQVISLIKKASSISEVTASYIIASKDNVTNPVETDANVVAGINLSGRINVDISTNLLMGIEDETASFSSTSADANTFYIVSRLMDMGGRRMSKSPKPLVKYPPGSVPQPSQNQLETKTQQKTGKKMFASAPKNWLDKPKIYKGSQTSVNKGVLK